MYKPLKRRLAPNYKRIAPLTSKGHFYSMEPPTLFAYLKNAKNPSANLTPKME